MLTGMLYPPEFIEGNPEVVEETIGWLIAKPIPPWVRIRQMEAVVAHDTYDRLPQIKAPTLVVGGEKDVGFPAEYLRLLASRIPNAELVILEALGHSSVAFTMDTYSHIMSGMQEDMMALLDELIPVATTSKLDVKTQ